MAQAAFSSASTIARQESLTSIRMIKAFGLEDRQSALFAADAADTGAKNMRVARIDARFDPTIYIADRGPRTCWPSAAAAALEWLVHGSADPRAS